MKILGQDVLVVKGEIPADLKEFFEPAECGECYVCKMVAVFREVRRVLRSDGTCWVNMGDSYASQPAGNKEWKHGAIFDGRDMSGHHSAKATHPGDGGAYRENKPTMDWKALGMKQKDLVGIPWMLAFALRADGWWLRQDIVWAKPNPMPESVTDRCTKSHEYIFLLTKSAHYYYDAEAIKEPAADSSMQRWNQDIENQHGSERVPGKTNDPMKAVGGFERLGREGANSRMHQDRDPSHSDERKVRTLGVKGQDADAGEVRSGKGVAFGRGAGWREDESCTRPMRNKRSVWEIATQPYSEAHFATFPEALVEPCILAGTSERGCCPQCGAGWERVCNKELVPTAKAAHTFVVDKRDAEADDQDQGSNRQKDGHKPGWINQTETTGWQPTCQCRDVGTEGLGTKPCIVLDPFAGSGTTGVVALRYHRDFIGIELNPAYAELSRKRIGAESPMFNEVEVIS